MGFPLIDDTTTIQLDEQQVGYDLYQNYTAGNQLRDLIFGSQSSTCQFIFHHTQLEVLIVVCFEQVVEVPQQEHYLFKQRDYIILGANVKEVFVCILQKIYKQYTIRLKRDENN